MNECLKIAASVGCNIFLIVTKQESAAEGKVYFDPQSITAGKARKSEYEAAGHFVSAVRKQR